MKELFRATINGEKVEIYVNPDDMLLDVLREEMYLTGTKKGCGQGECGACTIIMNHKTVNSCIVPVMKAMDAEIETIEGLEKDKKLHIIQEEFINEGSVQCGYCTPGMIMSSKSLLDKKLNPTKEEINKAMSGNICRCTGYTKIENAIVSAASRLRKEIE